MAFSATSWFNNGIVGIPQVGADVDIYDTSTTPKFAVGTHFTRSDGHEYVYGHFGTAGISSGGLVVSSDLEESGSTNASSGIYAAGCVTAIAGETIKPGSAGSRYVQIIGKGVLTDTFAGGYFQTTEGEGFGYQYRIKGNTAAVQLSSGSAYTYYVELYEPLVEGLASAQNTWYRIVGSRYANLESTVANTDVWVAGVTTRSHAASTYGWVQTKGLCGIRTDASNTSLGSLVAVSDTQPGQINGELTKDFVSDPKPIIGYCVASGTAATENMIAAIQLTLG